MYISHVTKPPHLPATWANDAIYIKDNGVVRLLTLSKTMLKKGNPPYIEPHDMNRLVGHWIGYPDVSGLL